MNTTVERLEPSKVRLTVTVEASEVDEAIEGAYKRIAGKLRVPGFRAGKAPKAVVDSHVGREAILADAQDDLLGKTYSDALDLEGLRPLEQPEMIGEIPPIEPGKDFEYTAQVEVRPHLTISSTDDLSIEAPPAAATDAEVDAQIAHTAERFATLEPVEDRGIEKDDFVLISFTGLVDGEEYDGNVVDRYLYEMNRGLMPEQFDEALIGAKAADEVVARFDIPDATNNPDFAGKPAEFTITVHEIKAKVLPVFDDEFASNAGGFDSFEDMRTSVRSQLDHSKMVGRSRQLETAARAALAVRLEGEVPEIMVTNMQGDMMRDFISGLESRNISVPDYLQATGATMEVLEAGIAEQAAASAREELALEALFRHMGWEVTDEDLDVEIATLSGSDTADPAELRRKWKASGVVEVLREQIMHRRAVEWLTNPENVAVVEVEPSTESDSEEQS